MTITRFCPKCQAETERNSGGDCKPCVRARGKAWYADNHERKAAKSAAWREANHERHTANAAAWNKANFGRKAATNAAWIKANKDRIAATNAARYAANPERVKANCAAYRAANPEKTKATGAAWDRANQEKVRIHSQNRRARKIEAGGSLSPDLAVRLFKLQRGKCPCCKQPLGDDYHLDHIMPIALGGANTDDNIQLLRSTCNHQKHAKHPVDFMQQRGFLL